MEDIRKVSFCPHCGNKSPQRLLHTQEAIGTGWTIHNGEEVEFDVVYFVASCDTCNQILVYQAVDDIPEKKYFTSADLAYPDSGELHVSIPKAISNIYNEALRIKYLAPNAYAVQIRRALEALCEYRGARSGSLQKMLSDLSAKGEIPSTLIEATELLRMLGNIGAHASEVSVRPWQVHSLDEFFRAVVEYVYVAPSKIKKFREGLSKFTSKTGA